MFPKTATTQQLADIPAILPGIWGETRRHPAPMCRYQRGQHWRFWPADNPTPDYDATLLADYVCTSAGDDDAKWRKVKG
jgi:hypothetical protein